MPALDRSWTSPSKHPFLCFPPWVCPWGQIFAADKVRDKKYWEIFLVSTSSRSAWRRIFFFFSSKYCKNISKSAPDTFQEFTCHLLKNINDAPVWDVVVPWFIEQKQRETKATSAWLPKTDRRITHGRMEHCSITLLGQALVWWPHLCKTGRKKTQLLPTSCSSLWTPFQTTDTKITDTWTACRQPCELTPTHCNTQWDMSS